MSYIFLPFAVFLQNMNTTNGRDDTINRPLSQAQQRSIIKFTMKQISILYLDPNRANGRRIAETLRAAGSYRVAKLVSLEELERELASSRGDLLLSEYGAAGPIGLGLLDLVQFRQPHLPVVLIFSLDQEQLVDEALQRGAAGYVLKTAAYLKRLPLIIQTILENEERKQERQRVERERAAVVEQMTAAQKRLHTLSQRLLEVQETERRSLARELHDQIGQALTAVKINLQATQRATDPATGARLAESVTIVERALQKVRNLSLELRPSLLDDLGLVSALRWYVDRQAQLGGFSAHFSAGSLSAQLAPHLETICFRVAQEALTNVIRHAGAGTVTVALSQQNRELELVIADDGCGFDLAVAREAAAYGTNLGLIGMEERAALGNGRLQIESAPGRGTTVRLILPLRRAGAADVSGKERPAS
jgi:signal transduction histidine kinase